MRQLKASIAVCLIGLAACSQFVLAPGAAQVQVTKASGEVAGCAPVGNLQVPKNGDGAIDVIHALAQIQNQTVGLGGNVAFVTEGSLRTPKAGVAYKCPSRSGAL
jgi:hypothetical protein